MAWFDECYSRILVDNHITEFSPSFMSSFDPVRYAELMKRAGVDASMVYASCHNGNCYYPTKVGHMHAGLAGRDIFGETVNELLKREIVPLAYHSVVYFNHTSKEHKDWQMANLPNGAHGGRYWMCCPNSKEYREFCRTQLAEILSYPVQGIFIDMVFWSTVCLCQNCRERYLAETGNEIPTIIDVSNPDWVKFLRTRESWLAEFAEYLTKACNDANPDVSVTQQFSPVMLGWSFGQSGRLADACAYASGDFYGGRYHQSLALKALDVYSKSRPFEFFTSRCVNLNDHTSMKSYEQMLCSASATIANAGAFVLIDAINPDGTLCDEVYERMSRVTQQLRPFTEVVEKIKPVPIADVGLYFSMPSHVDRRDNGKSILSTASGSNMTPSTEIPALREVLQTSAMLCRSHIPYKLVRSDKPDLSGLKTLIINNCAYMSETEVDAIREWVKNGGKLIATGSTSLYDLEGNSTGNYALADVLGVSFTGQYSGRVNYIGYDGEIDKVPTVDTTGRMQYVSADFPAPLVNAVTARSIARLYGTWTDPDDIENFASIHSNPPGSAYDADGITINEYGNGRCVYISSGIMAMPNYAQREFGKSIINTYGQSQIIISTNAPESVEITLLEGIDGSYLITLVNYQQDLPNVPVVDLSISFRLPEGQQPVSCTTLSTGYKHGFVFNDGIISLELKKLETIEMIHIV